MQLTEDQARQVYAVLVKQCGAPPTDCDSFVYHILEGCEEYRCCWRFGFGGKFYTDGCRVDGYPEEMTRELRRLRTKVNKQLKKLMEVEVCRG